jgi:hypothetical protein
LTSTIIKDYYNTYNNNIISNTQYNNIKTKKPSSILNKLQIGTTGLEELNNYNEFAYSGFSSNEFTNANTNTNTNTNINTNTLTNDMTSELNDFFNKLKL